MPVSVKASDTWRNESIPWFKPPTNVWVKPVRVYRKVGAAWQEVWPLVSGAVSSPAVAQPFRNSRIEWDFSWVAPSTGVAATRYIVNVYINGALHGAFNIVGATSFTLTNNGSGYQNVAGQSLTWNITPYTAENRAGPTTSGPTVVIAQVPPPPAPTGFAISMTDGLLTTSFSQAGGVQVTGVEMIVHAPGWYIATYYFGAGYTSTNSMPWNGQATAGGFAFYVTVRAYGPGGSSSTLQLDGTVPGDAQFLTLRFTGGLLDFNIRRSPSATATEVIYRNVNGGWVSNGTLPAGGDVYSYVSASTGWARDTQQYQVALRSRSIVGGLPATGRYVYSVAVRKMPQPYYVTAIDSNTWQNGAWRNDGTFIFQGYALGMNYAYVYYGNKFYDELSDGRVGYRLNINSASINIGRGSHGYNVPTSLRLWLHTSYQLGAAQLVDGGADLTAMTWEQVAWCVFPAAWARYLIDQTNGWRGVGFYSPDMTLYDGVYSLSFFATHKPQFVFDGQPALTIRVYHDG